VSQSAFAHLFSEFIQYTQARSSTASELERRLEEAGVGIGVRVLELVSLRDGKTRRETRMLGILQYINSNIWKALFGKSADALEKSVENEDEFMIWEAEPLVNQYISVPSTLPNLNCAAFVAGIIRGVLESAGFPATVQAHTVPNDNGGSRTVFLIKFAQEVLAREKILASA
ncbi:NO signaling/Golgi transport ligand-binding domain-containing protein, partial [Pavlovales sp. CCMP2436]